MTARGFYRGVALKLGFQLSDGEGQEGSCTWQLLKFCNWQLDAAKERAGEKMQRAWVREADKSREFELLLLLRSAVCCCCFIVDIVTYPRMYVCLVLFSSFWEHFRFSFWRLVCGFWFVVVLLILLIDCGCLN